MNTQSKLRRTLQALFIAGILIFALAPVHAEDARSGHRRQLRPGRIGHSDDRLHRELQQFWEVRAFPEGLPLG